MEFRSSWEANLWLCPNCKRYLSRTSEFFYRNKNSPDGLNSVCKKCKVKSTSMARKNNPERYRRSKEYALAWNRAHPENVFRNYLKSKYNLTPEGYQSILEKQGGSCAGCGRNQSKLAKKMAVDHDHRCCKKAGSCGKCIRGVLCDNCNQILGRANDDPSILRNLASYLESKR